MRDYSRSRRDGNHGMEPFDLRHHDSGSAPAVPGRGTSKYRLTYDDRGLQFLRTFVEAREKENHFEVLPAEYRDFVPDDNGSLAPTAGVNFRPVVNPFGREVTALEALPDDAPVGLAGLAMYVHNPDAVTGALYRAVRSCPDDIMLYLSILPMMLVSVPDAVSQLVSAIDRAGLVPQQSILDVSKTEIISQLDAFSQAVRQLKQASISLPIDNFGDGSAGLSLLAHVQPDRVRIGAGIVRNIHRSGRRLARDTGSRLKRRNRKRPAGPV